MSINGLTATMLQCCQPNNQVVLNVIGKLLEKKEGGRNIFMMSIGDSSQLSHKLQIVMRSWRPMNRVFTVLHKCGFLNILFEFFFFIYHLRVVEEWKSSVWIGGRGYQLPGCATKSARFQGMYVCLCL